MSTKIEKKMNEMFCKLGYSEKTLKEDYIDIKNNLKKIFNSNNTIINEKDFNEARKLWDSLTVVDGRLYSFKYWREEYKKEFKHYKGK